MTIPFTVIFLKTYFLTGACAPVSYASFLYILVTFIDIVYYIIGFHDDHVRCTFGIVKKGKYRPLSDFSFNFIMKVTAEVAESTGYIIEVIPELDPGEESNQAFFQ